MLKTSDRSNIFNIYEDMILLNDTEHTVFSEPNFTNVTMIKEVT